MLIDSHCHVYGFKIDELKNFKEVKIIGVAEDYESSIKNLELSENFSNIVPFVGFHPWNIPDMRNKEIEMIIQLVKKSRGLGEIGLDKKFREKYLDSQVKVFELFCVIASQNNLPMNIHALNSWEECFKTITKYNVKRVLFHWYSGPTHLLKELYYQGYFISINPAVVIQPKHRKILEEAELEMILTESDGPYMYRGMYLNPSMIRDLLNFIAKVKGAKLEDVEKTIEENFSKFLG